MRITIGNGRFENHSFYLHITKVVIIIIRIVTFNRGYAMQTIETFIPITQAKAKLLDMVRQLDDTNDTIAITKNGVPKAVMLSMRKFEGLLETIDILADSDTMEQFKTSLEDVKKGRFVDMDEVFEDV